MLRHAHEITAITNQTVNSYKRLVPGFEAPAYVSWAATTGRRWCGCRSPNRSVHPHRVPRPDPACNPYLAFAVILAAGLRGSRRVTSSTAGRGCVFELTDEERAAERLEPLPQSLDGALPRWSSPSSSPSLGQHIFEWFLRNKRREWAGYKSQVTPFEIDRYLRI